MTKIEKLLSISSESLGSAPKGKPKFFELYRLGSELFQMLEQKNGFYAFELALHVFPLASDITGTMTLDDWNSKTLWKSAYGTFADGLLFFAEDIFGDQFCLPEQRSEVLRFHAETGATEVSANSMEEWANFILSDYRVETGWPLASEWQAQNGPLPFGQRLQPKIPFVCGGKYELGNLWAGDATRGMLFKGDLALQIKDLPDGAQIRFQFKESEQSK